MVQWFFDNIPDFKAEKGFKTQFNVPAPSRDFMHLWLVEAVIPLEKLLVNWQYEGLNGSSNVTMELLGNNHQTHFKLTTEVLEDFDDAIPEFRRESCVGGWNYFIKDRLVQYLSSKHE